MPTYRVFSNSKGELQLVNQQWSWFGFFWYIWIFNGVINPWTLGAAGVCIAGGVSIALLDLSYEVSMWLYLATAVIVNIAMGLIWPKILSHDLEESGFQMVTSIEAETKFDAEKHYQTARATPEVLEGEASGRGELPQNPAAGADS